MDIVNSVQEIAKKNNTASLILNDFAKWGRFRRITNLDGYQTKLLRKGVKIVPEEFVDTFKAMEKAGLGSLVYGRGNNPNRFIWNYSLKWVGEAASRGEKAGEPVELKEGAPAPRKVVKRGRPKGAKNRRPRLAKTISAEAAEEIAKRVVLMLANLSDLTKLAKKLPEEITKQITQ
jgi:hypothetical protein